MSTPINKKLYEEITKETKLKYKRWPSLYASAYLSKEYVRRGGKYSEPKKNIISKQSIWFKEKWIQLLPYLKNNKIIECGDNSKTTKACRPMIKYNKNTPLTIDELIKIHGKKKLVEIAIMKNKNMNKNMNWRKGDFY